MEIFGEVVTKTYVDWSRDEHLREWAALQVISAARPDLVPVPIGLEEPEPEREPELEGKRRPGLEGELGAGSERELGRGLGSGPEPGVASGLGPRPEPGPEWERAGSESGLESQREPGAAGLERGRELRQRPESGVELGARALGKVRAGAGRPVVVMSRLAGVPMGGCLSAAQLDGLRVALDALWSVPSEGVESIDCGRFVARVRRSVVSWDGGGVIAEAHEVAREWLAGADADELVEPRVPVIGHGDPNLANYLWDGERVRIIDFEDSGRSDLAVELANLVEHLASRGTDWRPFLSRYDVDAERLRAARRLFAAFWLTLIRPGGPSAHRNPPGTAEAQAERLLGLLR
ncbi:phosphotransferase family protein [Kribbella italica]